MPAPASAEPVVVARIAGAFGVLGWVRLVSFTEPPENLLEYRPWLLAENGSWRQLAVAEVKPHGPGFVARFRDLVNREEAQALSGRLIAVPRSALPTLSEGGEFYWRDLVGLSVEDTDGRVLGQVDHLLDTGAQDVIAVKQDGRTMLIPFLARFVVDVDLAAGKLVVDWQEPE